MTGRGSFDDALDAAIDAMRQGEHLDAVLARFPRHAAALAPLLNSAPFGRPGAGLAAAAMSERLAGNFTIVRAAVQRAQMARDAAQNEPPRVTEPRAPWWQRRLAFASLSLPAGVIALAALAGISGAAAASVAVTGNGLQDIPAQVAGFVAHPLSIGGSGDDHDNNGGSGAATTPEHGAPAADNAPSPAAPASQNVPTLMTLNGKISGVHGNTFTLTTADGEYEVNIDGTTAVTGTIADGATATVTGDVTAQKNMHADSVDVSGAPDAPDAAPGHSDGAGQDTPAGDATPEPSKDKTPGPPADHTPGPPASHTAGPPGDHTPPAQGTNDGNGSGNGNNSGGGNDKKP